jgi:hypothetical protein
VKCPNDALATGLGLLPFTSNLLWVEREAPRTPGMVWQERQHQALPHARNKESGNLGVVTLLSTIGSAM